jgi:type VII secretion-associated serine protease mycosin
MGVAPAAQADDVRSQQWYLDAMQAEEMWKVSTGEGIKVAVVDTGVDPTTASLRGQVLPGEDLSGAAGEATDDYDGHGTSMAEIIAGTGEGGGIQGLAPGAKIIPIRVALSTLEGKSNEKSGSEAIRAAADSDAQIINMSFGGPYYDTEEEEAVNYALSKGKLLFAGTGNSGKGGMHFPSSYTGVVGVAATDEKGVVGKFSQYGPNTDLAAPGVNIPAWCDKRLKEYCPDADGTSAATAIASASAALIWSKHPDWTANQVLRVLVGTAGRKEKSDVASKYIGYGAVRPRIHLLEGEGDPGEPDRNPIGATEPTPSPSASSPDGGSDAKNDGRAGKDRVEKASSEPKDSSDLWIYLGAGAAAAVVVAGAFVLVRRTRRT